MLKLLAVAMALVLCSCNKHQTIGTIERLDASLDLLIDKDAKTEIITEGYEWSEGPVWVESEKMLLFSDVPTNKVYKWTEAKGAELYLTPSGYTGSVSRGGEIGSNGLTLSKENKLTICQHGN